MAALEEARGERTAREGSSSSALTILVLRPSGDDDGCCRGAAGGALAPGSVADARAVIEWKGKRRPTVAMQRERFEWGENALMHRGLELALVWLFRRDIIASNANFDNSNCTFEFSVVLPLTPSKQFHCRLPDSHRVVAESLLHLKCGG